MPAQDPVNLYALILGLPDDLENPDYYQVLGLPRFTDDPKAIRDAAVSQNSKLLKWQNSEYFKDSLPLMQQIVEAKRVLENPETRRDYDATLRQEQPTADFGRGDTIDSAIPLQELPEAEPVGDEDDTETYALPPRQKDVNPEYARRRREQLDERRRREELRDAVDSEFSILGMHPQLFIACLVASVVIGILLYTVVRPRIDFGSDSPDGSQVASENDSERDTRTPPDSNTQPKPTGPIPNPAKAPFSEQKAKTSQANWAAHLGREVVIKNSIGMELVLLPPGVFSMGAPKDDVKATARELPQHPVELTDSMYMGRTEVTQSQWKAVMGTAPWIDERYWQMGDDFPASYISWNRAIDFCNELTDIEEKAGRLPTGWRYELPTEAQWEYACRAGSETLYSFGDDESDLKDVAWFSEVTWGNQERYAHMVARRLRNNFGLHDMHGNVSEWCRDWYVEDYYNSSPATNPPGPRSGTLKVHRGGSWSDISFSCRSSARAKSDPTTRRDDVGFRVVLVPIDQSS